MCQTGSQMKASSQKRGESEGEEPLSLAVLPKALQGSASLVKLSPSLSLLIWSINRPGLSGRRDTLEFRKFAGRQRRGSRAIQLLPVSSLAREGAVPHGSASKSINASSSLEAAWLSWASVTHCYTTQLNYLGWVGSICHTVNEDLAKLSKHIGCLGCWVSLEYTHRGLWLKLTGTRWMWQGQKHYTHRRQTRHCTSTK